ncbi:MAG: hypothetical protein Phog2KO_30880 [Phototrophicaceae bacterium]
MKTQFSFLDYIVHMTCSSTAFSIVATILLATIVGLVSGEGFIGSVFGIGLSMFSAIFGLIVGFTLSLILSLVVFIFFNPESVTERLFQIVSFAIIAIFNTMFFSILHNLLAENYPITIWEIGLVVVTIPVIMSAHRFASQYLVTTVEKRKVK